MAGDWIAVRTDLWEDPKVIQLASAMCPHFVRNDADKCPQIAGQMSAKLVARCAVVGALQRTWSLFDTYSDDGILHGYDAESINEAVGLPGWAENLHHIGWLDVSSQSVAMHNFEEWMSESAKRRIKEAKRKRQSRKKTSASCPQNVRKRADKTRTREEKRREEKSIGVPPKSPVDKLSVTFDETTKQAFIDWTKWRAAQSNRLELDDITLDRVADAFYRQLQSSGPEHIKRCVDNAINKNCRDNVPWWTIIKQDVPLAQEEFKPRKYAN